MARNRMVKLKKILLSNWLLSALLMAGALFAMLTDFLPLQLLELKAYDYLALQRKRADFAPVVLVAIDEPSIQTLGKPAWPRNYMARVIRRVSQQGAKAIGVYTLYDRQELNPGLAAMKNLRQQLQEQSFSKIKSVRHKIDRWLAASERKLAHDRQLIRQVKSATNIVLPLQFATETSNDAPARLTGWLRMNSLDIHGDGADFFKSTNKWQYLEKSILDQTLQAKAVTQPFAALSTKSGGLGHINFLQDPDRAVRQAPLMVVYEKRMFPSLALQLAAKYADSTLKELVPGSADNGLRSLRLRNLRIQTDSNFNMRIDYNGGTKNYTRVSFADVYNNKIPNNLFRDKIVLIGTTAKGSTRIYRTPVEPEVSGVEIMAHMVENLVNGRQLSRPAWALAIEILAVVCFSLSLGLVVPRIGPHIGLLIMTLFVGTYVGFAAVLFMANGYWLKLIAPLILALSGYILIRYKTTLEKKRDESQELNKMLGLSFQDKGMLDAALEKFMQCSVETNSVKGLLYNLGLDFERKRMFNKALSVYEHIRTAGRFKDVDERIKRLKAIGERTMMSATLSLNGDTLMLESGTAQPTVGRYEIIKEIGQGAMGTVYLGKDPRINRQVAIKTLKYNDVEQDQLPKVKRRFFKEAEAAGKLSHPNIVTVYDVGEDHDLAYIAMELISGKELTGYCRKGSLLPINRVLSIVIQVAEALDYAHQRDVVHRDIKPANIMLIENEVRVTDFGIARVISSSSTRTGDVFGTPNYMSPEQVAGKKVDGRSDLFSLGTVFYEMLTGQKPFRGSNLANLMYAIAQAKFIPVTKLAPHTPRCCVKIINRLLTRNLTDRFPSATHLLKDARRCAENM